MYHHQQSIRLSEKLFIYVDQYLACTNYNVKQSHMCTSKVQLTAWLLSLQLSLLGFYINLKMITNNNLFTGYEK